MQPSPQEDLLAQELDDLEALDTLEDGYRDTHADEQVKAKLDFASSKLGNIIAQLETSSPGVSRILNSEGKEIGQVRFEKGRFVVTSKEKDRPEKVQIDLRAGTIRDTQALGILSKMGLLTDAGDTEASQSLAAHKALGRLTRELLVNKIDASKEQTPSFFPKLSTSIRLLLAMVICSPAGVGAGIHLLNPGPNIIGSTYRKFNQPDLDERKAEQLTYDINKKLEAGEKNYFGSSPLTTIATKPKSP